MKNTIWILPCATSFILGVLLVKYFVVHPLEMSIYLLGTMVALFFLVGVLYFGFRSRRLAVATLLSLVFFLAGYTTMTRIFLSREDERPVPVLTRDSGDPGLGHTAVIYFTHGEPETYDPIGWINQFNEFDEQKIPFVPLPARPLFVYQLRNKYLKVGKSEHRGMHAQMMGSLEEAFRTKGDMSTRFYLSFLDDNPRPDAAVIQALNEGASEIIVCEVFTTISNHTAEGEKLIEELHVADRFGVPVIFTLPLYNSTTLQRMFVHRVNANLDGTDKGKVGVLLVGHGQPDEWDIEWPTETEQELSFRNDVLDLLVADGFRAENLSLAWMEFKLPKPAEKVEEFYRNGVEKVFYFSAAISADAIHSQYDIPELVSRADVPQDYPLINLGAWNDDPIVIKAIQERIEAVME